jgi:hypothetical protein
VKWFEQKKRRFPVRTPVTLQPLIYLVKIFARPAGIEPVTSAVHQVHYFHNGVDYIITLSSDLGAPVSSLYGAPPLLKPRRVPTVFAYPHKEDLAFTVIPEFSSRNFSRELHESTGQRSNQLSYGRNEVFDANASLKILYFLSR